MGESALVDLSPLLRLLLLGAALGSVPLAWLWLRHRHADAVGRLRALTLLTLFLTFDLVLFGAFTRLTDSGLGCPDWPGCYGSVSPVGARDLIDAAQSALPSGPVTHGKAWIEMIHRYLASAVGLLIVVSTLASWRLAWRGSSPVSPWWATATLAWVCLQGAFGAWTVTLKLYPAIVTLHLLGGLGLLILLALQAQAWRPRPWRLPAGLRRALGGMLLLALLQAALGGWVSTNYAVLACRDFPTCHGVWWPQMDLAQGFTLLRPLGMDGRGGFLPFPALTAIHMAHRIGALIVFIAIAALAWRLLAQRERSATRWARAFGAVAAWQFASGLGNVVFDWPLAFAVAHTGGAAALVTLLAMAWQRARQGRAATVRAALPRVDPAFREAGRAGS